MLLHPSRCAERLHEEARSIAETPLAAPLPFGLPLRELTRSPAAARVARFAGIAGLGVYHYEHRVQLDLPEDWVPEDRPELVEAPEWGNGVLPERKYQSFRHDQAFGSFNPGHRAKWGTHELCHGLVGYGWWPGATPFELATASRLAELVPVALWYFFDEAFLQRCPLHLGGGALFRGYCQDCETLAAPRVQDSDAEGRIAEGLRFLDRELAAVVRSRRLGRPVAHQWATLDLCSDGIAYAVAHQDRLGSDTFASYHALHGEGNAWSSLDALEARVVEVARAIAGEIEAPEPIVGDWKRQDLAWRLWCIRHECEGEARDELERLALGLNRGEDVAERYRMLHAEYLLPAPEEAFAVGYALPGGLGRSVRQIQEGLAEACPVSLQLLEDAGELDQVSRFVEQDGPVRQPLVERWAAFSRNDVKEIARYEAALLGCRSDPLRVLGAWQGGPGRLAEGVRLLRAPFDLVDAASRIDSGSLSGSPGGRIQGSLERSPTALLVGRDAQGELLLVDVPPDVAYQLEKGGDLHLPEGHGELLATLGVLLPERWD